MKYYRDSFFLNITSIIRNLYGLVRGKVTALLMGVQGVGILGQINAFFALQGQITNLGFNTILVNRLGKIDINKDKNSYLQILLFTLLVIFCANFILLFFFIAFKHEFSLILFSNNKYSDVFLLLAFLQ